MRKHDVRKWLHAILDLLPVILIPVFMIYSHRHTIDSGSIQVQEKIAVDFNQLVQNGNFDDGTNGYFNARSVVSVSQNVATINGNADNYYIEYTYSTIAYHTYLARVKMNAQSNNNARFYSYYDNLVSNVNSQVNGSNFILYNNRFTATIDANNSLSRCLIVNYSIAPTFYVSDFNVFDLTQMFGLGNEPTIDEFNQLFPQSYYEYTLSHKELVDGDLVTLNDTDIMSQFTYQLYNSVDKYFNMGNVFHLNEVYDWFNLNIFNGQAPIYIFIVYQIVLYELIMDLLMLLYALFMWFIDMIQKLMEKPLNSVK